MENMTITEVAKIFGVSRMTIHRWLKKGILFYSNSTSRYMTVTRTSVEQLQKNEDFIASIKRDTKKENSNQQLQLILEQQKQILENQKIILAEMAELKKSKQASIPTDIVTKVVTERKEPTVGQEPPQAPATSKKRKKKEEREAEQQEIEEKAKFVMEVSEQVNEAFGANSRCNPFSMRYIDPSSNNITSLLRRGKRPRNQTRGVYDRIFKINNHVNVFDDLSDDNINIDLKRVEEINELFKNNQWDFETWHNQTVTGHNL